MKFSIIIPTWRRAKLLFETLDSLAAQTEKDFEVLVVCDGHDRETQLLAAEYVSNYQMQWVFRESNEGAATARNIGASGAQGEILLFLDDDVTPAEDCLSQHWKHHKDETNGPGLIVCGKTVEKYKNPPASHIDRFFRILRDRVLADSYDCYSRMQLDFDRCVYFGLNCSIRRQTFLDLGGFTSGLLLVEEMDIGTRLYDQGIRFRFNVGAVVYHNSTKNLSEYFRRYLASAGQGDARRVRERGQRTPQTIRLAGMHRGGILRPLSNRVAWEYPHAMAEAGEFCRKATELTGSESCFWLWFHLNKHLYWQGVRSEGVTRDEVQQLTGSSFRVLMFHSISTSHVGTSPRFCLSPTRFARLLRWMQKMGFNSCLPEQCLAAKAPPRSVILTFDDGYEDFYGSAFPILQEMGLQATLFVVADRIGHYETWSGNKSAIQRRLLSAAQIREVHQHGVQIGSHSLTHPVLTRLSNVELRREVTDSKHRLEDLLGNEVFSFAYPWGEVDVRVRGAVAEAGYKFAMGTEEGLNFWNDRFSLKRVNVSGQDTLFEFTLKLATGRDYRQRLFRMARRIGTPAATRA